MGTVRAVTVIVIILVGSLHIFAQSDQPLWEKVDSDQLTQTKLYRKSLPKQASFYQVDLDRLRDMLGVGLSLGGPIELLLPTAHGIESFEVLKTPMMASPLQIKYPMIQTYTGKSSNDAGASIRFTITPYGFYGMIFSPQYGTEFIDPYTEDRNFYIAYAKRNLPDIQTGAICHVSDPSFQSTAIGPSSIHAKNANDGLLRTYRIAISATVEYSEFHWVRAGLSATNTEAEKRLAALAAIVVTLARNNFIYERDLSLRMELVPNNDLVVFINSDNFDNDNTNNILLSQNTQVLNNIIGGSNYDIGHVFSTGGGGVASLASPCTSRKAQGVTGLVAPIGDPYDIDFVAHEIGHQFGAFHTFNGTAANCAGGNRTSFTAYEPGSGSTIMAYAGICPPQNVQLNSDAYFHQISLENIFENISPGGLATCSQNTLSLNAAPVAIAGADYVIPGSTPYKLLGASTDVDGTSSHTYTWEQYDLGAAGLPQETLLDGPLVRSFPGGSDPIRYIPELPDILINGGNSTEWEKLASVSRPMTFALTVRDNDPRGGQTAVDFMNVLVDANAGPFEVTSQNSNRITWVPNTTETITWNVAGTNANSINEAFVNILLSIDGGLSFDRVLASNVPNTGSADITVPSGIVAPSCRVMVESATGIFFNVNTQDFKLNARVTETCTTYASATLNLPIADGTGSGNMPISGPVTANIINIPDNSLISDIVINVDIEHPNISDLIFEVSDPLGNITRLWQFNCNNEANLDVNFQDGAPAVVCASPTTGIFSPFTPMTSFLNNTANGNWTLAMADFFAGDTGSLTDWSIDICTVVVEPLSNEDYALNDFKLIPNPNNGNFQVSFEEVLISPTTVQVFDLNGRNIFSQQYHQTGDFTQQLNLGTLPSGMYLITVLNANRKHTDKFIVQ